MGMPVVHDEIDRLRATARIYNSIGPSLELEEIARLAVRELVDLLDCDACAILLIEGNELKVVCEKGFSHSLGVSALPLDLPPIQEIVHSRKSLTTGNVANGIMAGCVPRGCSMVSWLCSPIIVDEQVIGLIHVDSGRKDAFSQDDLNFVEYLAGGISVAVERSLIHAQMRDLATKDELTGCFNRRKFNLDLEGELACAASEGHHLSLLMIDIDWFKRYNDAHGHQQGDVLLHRFGRLIKTSVRPLDRTYRYGGEEFTVLLPGSPATTALATARRLCRVVRETEFERAETSQPGGRLTASIGVATYPDDASNCTQLLADADSALCKAKELGRNRVRTYGASS
jgi:diguanylate cyclase (GGDEF)-like protein